MPEFVDPEPVIEERVAAELALLRDELKAASDRADRKRLGRELRRRERKLRRSLGHSRAHW